MDWEYVIIALVVILIILLCLFFIYRKCTYFKYVPTQIQWVSNSGLEKYTEVSKGVLKDLPRFSLETNTTRETNGQPTTNGRWKVPDEMPDKRYWKGLSFSSKAQKYQVQRDKIEMAELKINLRQQTKEGQEKQFDTIEGFGSDEAGQFGIAGLLDWNSSGRIAFTKLYITSRERQEYRGWIQLFPTPKVQDRAEIFIICCWYQDTIKRCRLVQQQGYCYFFNEYLAKVKSMKFPIQQQIISKKGFSSSDLEKREEIKSSKKADNRSQSFEFEQDHEILIEL